ncbi:pyrroline-5-carboxylate reductase [Paenibacillus darwinianus]|uniref:Pyrroline-5-carboxylate reductase n=1 Tax=Paenibacillus darwinianus TaxID=1380763 RepID=A0A9W5S2K2_9BACL|nr:pyrroline-5-carboxylate reductase [Paenibacillus darwinianus]EXX91135.1 pyrroline-5-carboxylate reductase [Paenibacillus darwinianus]EXX91945.1 pyrroline-5-carboxylate reductase [Paenibacillus darwinianus]EXX92644.1 pyrroline-5-carboxylate reductase [Paenibacillus darwinianus]
MSQNNAAGAAGVADLRFCFYGAGSMAEAIVRGLLGEGLARPERISVVNRSNVDRLNELREVYGVQAPAAEADKSRLLREADVIFLCMKPKDADVALRGLAAFISEKQLLVSVIAGLSTATIGKLIDKPVAIIRTMPNTSSTIGLGATGLCYNDFVTTAQQATVEALFRAIGITAVVEERMMDAVTGLSGSGPAYIYYVMEAMIEAGMRLGLSQEASHELTVQSVLGAASMVKETGEAPAELRRKIMSPGGTTQAAIELLNDKQVSETLVRAVLRAAERAGEMGAALERSTIS